jgi:hypothetical protein
VLSCALQEYCDECEGSRKLVRRDAALADDALLAERHAALTGDFIYEGLVNGFRVSGWGGGSAAAALPVALVVGCS